MNRIKELAKQARESEPYECSYGKDQWLETFAKLIIQECQSAMQPMLRDMISRGQAVDLMDKHFGITTETRYQDSIRRGANEIAKEIDRQVMEMSRK